MLTFHSLSRSSLDTAADNKEKLSVKITLMIEQNRLFSVVESHPFCLEDTCSRTEDLLIHYED